MEKQKTAIIIGAGPAGLTAAYELLTKTDIKPVILEMSGTIGGISRTVEYKGNRIDIGGHRFFSKSERVMEWWQQMLPVEDPHLPDSHKKNRLLVRKRVSRIYFLRKFFDYPVTLSTNTVKNLGFIRMGKIAISYLRIRIAPLRSEKNLEDFFINRFGKELYKTFFKDYTEKVWGVTCDKIKPEWGAQRIKGISVAKVIKHAFGKIFRQSRNDVDVNQKTTETSLIGQFLYPKFGPGQMWERVAEKIVELGGEIIMNIEAVAVAEQSDCKKIATVTGKNSKTGTTTEFSGDYFLSTMPIKNLIAGWKNKLPEHIGKIAAGLVYRDFITVGLLLNKLSVKNPDGTKIKDNWIYIQEPDVRLGRVQIFNNWSPYLVHDPKTVWLGLEYFCNEGDEFWSLSDSEIKSLSGKELAKIGIVTSEDILDGTVIRMPKAYPAYFGTYENIESVTSFLDEFDNLFLIGRNGMHRYNNQDHSMLTAMEAVSNIIAGKTGKENIWNVNLEDDYHETHSKKPTAEKSPLPGSEYVPEIA